MGASPTQLPPIVTPIVDTHTGLPTLPEYTWRQLLLLGRSAWIAYTPTTTNLTAITLNDCAFCQLGKLIVFRVALGGTTGGVNRTTFTLPFQAKSLNQTFVAVIDASPTGGNLSALSPVAADFLTITIVTLPGAGAHTFIIEGVYEAQ